MLEAQEDLFPELGSARAAEPGDFEEFWLAYPVKVGKLYARRCWGKALSEGVLPPTEQVLYALEQQKRSPRWQVGVIPNPSTWLNQGRWLDDARSLTAVGVRSAEPVYDLGVPNLNRRG